MGEILARDSFPAEQQISPDKFQRQESSDALLRKGSSAVF